MSLVLAVAAKDLKVLAIDTTARIGSVALTDGHALLGEYLLCAAKTHSEKLLALIHQILKDTQVALNSIDMVAVSVGPGSFTGLRVGISTAQGLAFALAKDVIGVATLEVVAFQAGARRNLICPMIAARNQEVYTCLFRTSETGSLTRLTQATVIEPEQWLARVKEPMVLLGDGAHRYRATMQPILPEGSVVLPLILGLPRASSVAHLAREQYLNQQKSDRLPIAPIYIKPCDAELNAHQRKGSFQPFKTP